MYPVTVDGPRVLLRDFREDDLDGCMWVVGDPAVTWFLSFDNRSRRATPDPGCRRRAGED
jgi:hypothetical protein